MELLCTNCGSPFRIYPNFKYRSGFKRNFPYLRNIITLGECVTPVVEIKDTYLKLDYFQPTFSYKDRGSRILISFLNERIKKDLQLAEDSSGNAGASIAAYGARAGFSVNVFVPEDASGPKINLIRSYGANIFRVNGNRETVRSKALESNGFYVGHSVFPEFRDGIRSLAYEIYHQFHGQIPDNIFIPTSAGTLLLGLYEGLLHLKISGYIDEIPHLIAVQPELMSPIRSALNGITYVSSKRRSIADALVTEKPPLMDEIVSVLRSYGESMSVTEEEIISARNNLSSEGVMTEYSSAVAYACSLKYRKKGSRLIILTGNGLKNKMVQSAED
ncbi:MAG: pyridoxal-phosphate dependent enzyme [Candidatus Thermoplasmatota archaeon]|nr:pyridoxal-phosphate dependent enzyme [Candidatus Thermoplasmatota archaeon]